MHGPFWWHIYWHHVHPRFPYIQIIYPLIQELNVAKETTDVRSAIASFPALYLVPCPFAATASTWAWPLDIEPNQPILTLWNPKPPWILVDPDTTPKRKCNQSESDDLAGVHAGSHHRWQRKLLKASRPVKNSPTPHEELWISQAPAKARRCVVWARDFMIENYTKTRASGRSEYQNTP